MSLAVCALCVALACAGLRVTRRARRLENGERDETRRAPGKRFARKRRARRPPDRMRVLAALNILAILLNFIFALCSPA